MIGHSGKVVVAVAAVVMAAGCASSERAVDTAILRQEVLDTERAFAWTMADRDLEAFAGFLADETVFLSGEEPLQGRESVVAAWSQFFEGPDAPFSWEPETVIVLESGTLALSTGPVFDPEGRRIATFTSVWQHEGRGRWRIVFDRGCDACVDDGP